MIFLGNSIYGKNNLEVAQKLLNGFTHCPYKLTEITPAHNAGRKWIDAVASPPYYEVGTMSQLMLTHESCIERYPDESIAKLSFLVTILALGVTLSTISFCESFSKNCVL